MTELSYVFGGGPLQQTDENYVQYDLTSPTKFGWVIDNAPYTAAALMDLNVVGPNIIMTLSEANKVSNGTSMLICNRGVDPLTVSSFVNVTIGTIAPGKALFIYLKDNRTVGGIWNSLAIGLGVSALDAASFAGLGLEVYQGKLATAEQGVEFSGNLIVAPIDRAKSLVWTGGVGTVTLPPFVSIDATFFFSLRNQGSGSLTVSPASGNIDGASSITLQPSESVRVHSTGTNWYTVGRGRSTQFSFTQLVKTVDGGTDVLTQTEAANVVQKYQGVLAADEIIVLPSIVQVYYVSNACTGSFNLTFKTAGVGSTVTVPANQNAILFCDGVNVINASTTIAGFASLILAQGSASTPPISFTGDPDTGIFQPTSGLLSVTANGMEVARFQPSGMLLPVAIATGDNSTQAVTSAWVRAQLYLDQATADGRYLRSFTGGDIAAALGYVPQAALGYTPANKAGDLITGPFEISNNVGSPSGGWQRWTNTGALKSIVFSVNNLGGGAFLNNAATNVNITWDDAGNFSTRGIIAAGSDARWKKNVELLKVSQAMRFIKSLEVKTYELHGELSLGLIAQQVMMDPLSERLVKRDDKGFFHLDYNGVAMAMVPVVQNLIEEVARLYKKLDDLEEQLRG